MEPSRVLSISVTVALVIVYAVGSGWWVSAGDAWYQELSRPRWQPPDLVFGLIWPYNFVALVAVGVVVSAHGTGTARTIWLVGLSGSIALALVWARLFYVDHALTMASIALVLAALATLPIVAIAFATRRWAGIALLPYQVWLALAASLSIGYTRLN